MEARLAQCKMSSLGFKRKNKEEKPNIKINHVDSVIFWPCHTHIIKGINSGIVLSNKTASTRAKCLIPYTEQKIDKATRIALTKCSGSCFERSLCQCMIKKGVKSKKSKKNRKKTKISTFADGANLIAADFKAYSKGAKSAKPSPFCCWSNFRYQILYCSYKDKGPLHLDLKH